MLTSLNAKETFKEFKQKAPLAKEASTKKDKWELCKLEPQKRFYEKQKPSSLPVSVLKIIDPLGPRVYIDTQEQNSSQIDDYEDSSVVEGVEFFGTVVALDVPKSMRKEFSYKDLNSIVKFLESMEQSEYVEFLDKLKNSSAKLALNDWGIYLLISKLSSSIYSDKNSAKLFAYFVLSKLGYGVKVGIADSKIVLMHYAKNIYDVPSYTFDGKKYYILEDVKDISTINVYRDTKTTPLKEIDFSLERLPLFAKDIKTKEIKFSYSSTKYTFNLPYNKNLLDFMATYPTLDYDIYLNSAMDEVTFMELSKALKEHINSKKSSQAIDFVLHFVQNAFVYEVDDKAFSRQKTMFAQEALFYDKSDCEDRVVLFAYILKRLFDVEIAAIKYEDHMSSALYVPMNGDKVKIKSKNFIVADPSYQNASIGESMEKYRKLNPKEYIIMKNY